MRDGQVVKGVRFRDHRVVGDILELAGALPRRRRGRAGVLRHHREPRRPVGGSRLGQTAWRASSTSRSAWPAASACVADAEEVLASGAEKISINSPALADPELIDALSERFGAQCVVVGIDSQTVGNDYRVQQYTGDLERARDTSRRHP